ncbi:hypothetical protein GJ496_004890 [Pomphorhynchus laevis]|nr:hypothetical protein GJ496_004890 [Pomphorhynchus laevis]
MSDNDLFVLIDDSKINPTWTSALEWRPNATFIDITNLESTCRPIKGLLNDCWFVSALISIANQPALLEQVFKFNQEIKKGNELIFKFWKFGSWVEVRVDDKLPIIIQELDTNTDDKSQNKSVQKLCLASNSANQDELWIPLLEKAFIKFIGGYEHMTKETNPQTVYTSLTGSIAQRIAIKDFPNDQKLYNLIKTMINHRSLVSCCKCNVYSKGDKYYKYVNIYDECDDPRLNHAYTLTGTASIEFNNKIRYYIKLKNPWDPNSWDFKTITDENIIASTRRRSSSTLRDDERLVDITEFRQKISILDACHIFLDVHNPVLCMADYENRNWSTWEVNGQWENKCGFSDGNIWLSSQYLMKIEQRSDDRNIFVCDLHQIDAVRFIQIRLYKVKAGVEICMDKTFSINELERVHTSGPYLNQQSVSMMTFLNSGFYVVLPTISSEENEIANRDFLLRIMIGNRRNTVEFFDLFQNEKDICNLQVPNQKSSPIDNIKLLSNPIKVSDSKVIRVEIPIKFISLKNILNSVEFACMCSEPDDENM